MVVLVELTQTQIDGGFSAAATMGKQAKGRPEHVRRAQRKERARLSKLCRETHDDGKAVTPEQALLLAYALKQSLEAKLPDPGDVKVMVAGMANMSSDRTQRNYQLGKGWECGGHAKAKLKPVFAIIVENRQSTRRMETAFLAVLGKSFTMGNDNAGAGGALGIRSKRVDGEAVFTDDPKWHKVYVVLQLNEGADIESIIKKVGKAGGTLRLGVGDDINELVSDLVGGDKAASHLRRHVAVVHEQRRDHACPQCDAAFGEASTLTRHVRAVHRCSPCKQLGDVAPGSGIWSHALLNLVQSGKGNTVLNDGNS